MLYLALLGGSYCKTQSTSGMSTPRAITSVHTKIPLESEKTAFCVRAPPLPSPAAFTDLGDGSCNTQVLETREFPFSFLLRRSRALEIPNENRR